MKKILLALPVPILAVVAFAVWRNLPEKRYARHVMKARLFAQEGNLNAANSEYERAFSASGGYTPYASLEVLKLTNQMNLQDGKPDEALKNTEKFTEKYKTNLEGKAVLAGLAFQLGKAELGFSALDDLFARDPSNFQGRLLLTHIRASQGRLDLAEQQLRILYGNHPDSLQALLPLAEILLREGRSPESRELLRVLLEKRQKNARARLLLVDSYLLQRDLDSAHLVLDQWQESDPEQRMQVQIRKARLYSLAGRLEEAKEALRPYLARKEDNLQALSDLAILFANAGQYDSAVAAYRAIADISPKARPTSELMLYYLFMKTQNPARALEALKTLQISDKRPALMPLLIAAYLAIGQEHKAQEAIDPQPDSLKAALSAFMRSVLPDREFLGQWALIGYFGANHQPQSEYRAVEEFHRRWPRQPLAIELRVKQLSGRGKHAEAARVLATLDKPDIPQRVAYIQLLAKAGEAAKARGAAEKLAADAPGLRGVNMVLADSWMKSDKAKAVAYYEKELALDPGNVAAINNLAWEYGVNRGDLAKAAPYLELLKEKKNLDPRILDTIGWILAINGKAGEAEPYLRGALHLVPDLPDFQYHMAYVLKAAGKRDEARKLLEQALASPEPFEERKQAEALLAEPG